MGIIRNIRLTKVATPLADCQPASLSTGRISKNDTITPIQPVRIVCTITVIKPPAMVPNNRAEAAWMVWASLSSTTNTTAISEYQT